MSLIEVLIAMLLLLTVFMGSLPLFTRAVSTNQRGADASQMASFLNSSFEELNQASINHDSFVNALQTSTQLSNYYDASEGGDEDSAKIGAKALQLTDADFSNLRGTDFYRGTVPQVLDSGPKTADTKLDHYIGDERWRTLDDLDEVEGDLRWIRDVFFFNYDLSDVHIGTVAVGNGAAGYQTGDDPDEEGESRPTEAGTLVQQGHPKLYDSPLGWDDRNPPDLREVRVAIRSAASSTPVSTGSRLVVGQFRVY